MVLRVIEFHAVPARTADRVVPQGHAVVAEKEPIVADAGVIGGDGKPGNRRPRARKQGHGGGGEARRRWSTANDTGSAAIVGFVVVADQQHARRNHDRKGFVVVQSVVNAGENPNGRAAGGPSHRVGDGLERQGLRRPGLIYVIQARAGGVHIHVKDRAGRGSAWARRQRGGVRINGREAGRIE